MYGYEIFHNEIAEAMIDAVRNGRNPHAWIIYGEEGMGRGEFAKLISAAVVCLNKKNAPCGECRSCVMSKAGTHPDIRYVLPENGKKTIGVEVIRKFNDDVFIRPFFSDNKVYIIDGDLLLTAAQNALLKTIEEPPEYAVFIITSTHLETILDTVQSRCALVKLPNLGTDRVSEYIEGKIPSLEGRAGFYAQFSGGNPGRALRLALDENFNLLRKKSFDVIEKIFSSKTADAFEVSDFFDKNKDDAGDIIDILLLFFRDMLFIGCGYTNMTLNTDYTENLRNIGAYTDIMPYAIDVLSKCAEMNKNNVSAKHMGAYLALTIKKAIKTR